MSSSEAYAKASELVSKISKEMGLGVYAINRKYSDGDYHCFEIHLRTITDVVVSVFELSYRGKKQGWDVGSVTHVLSCAIYNEVLGKIS